MAKIDLTKLPKVLTDKYAIENETFKREVKFNPKDRISVEIGDSKQPDFKPQFKFMRWDNEVNFSLRAEEKAGAVVETQGEKIKYITPDYEVHLYDKPEVAEDGGFEFEWVLKTKPVTNVLTATIQTKGSNFFYQLPLTQQEIDEGASRPENVEGSYAVYHKTKGGMNDVAGMEYKTGKAFHIYRPKVTDANGVETWGELNIDEENGLLTVTIDQEWLDNAVYPVIVDPTFGYTKQGVTNFETTTDSLFASNVNVLLGIDVTVVSVSFYGLIEGAGLGAVAGVYDSSGNLQSPQSSELTIDSTTGQWWTLSFSGPTLSAGTTYYPTVFLNWTSSTNSIHIFRDAAVAGDSKFQNTAYPTWPDPATFSDSSNKYSVYATFTDNTILGNPVAGNDTFRIGLTAAGSLLQGHLFTAPVNGTLASMSVYIVSDGTTKLTMGIYDVAFDTLIAQTAEINPTTGWNTATFASPPSVTASTQYRLAVWCEPTTTDTTMAAEDNLGDIIYTNNHTYSGTMPANPDNELTDDYLGSIYATYTAAGGVAPKATAYMTPNQFFWGY